MKQLSSVLSNSCLFRVSSVLAFSPSQLLPSWGETSLLTLCVPRVSITCTLLGVLGEVRPRPGALGFP